MPPAAMPHTPVAQPPNDPTPTTMTAAAERVPSAATDGDVSELDARAPQPAAERSGAVDDAPHHAAVVAVSTIVPAIEGGLARLSHAVGELRDAMVNAARREPFVPAPAPTDLGPVVHVLQAQLALSARQGEHGAAAVGALAQCVGDAAVQLQDGFERAIGAWTSAANALTAATSGAAAGSTAARTRAAAPAAEPRPKAPARRSAAALLGLAALLVAWSVLLWIKTGDARLALGTLVGGNALACCWLLAARRS
jgi:hypothetical protein